MSKKQDLHQFMQDDGKFEASLCYPARLLRMQDKHSAFVISLELFFTLSPFFFLDVCGVYMCISLYVFRSR